MPPKTKHEIFRDWLAIATINELEEKLIELLLEREQALRQERSWIAAIVLKVLRVI